MKIFFSSISILMFTFFVPTQEVNQVKKLEYKFNDLFPLEAEANNWVDSTLASLTLREKIAQLVFPYTNGKDTIDNAKGYKRIIDLVKDEQVGGILFLQGDINNQISIANKLQGLSKIPLLVTLDMERGVGMRLEDGVEFPYKMAFAAAGDPNLDFEMAKAAAAEGRAIGVHQNFAPLVDVVNDYRNPIINVRAYSSDPDVIGKHSDEFIKGMHEGGMITTAKHFPGHGATDLDSHNELPLIDLKLDELWKKDLKTFQSAINSGVKSVMVGHLDVPELTAAPGLPATFSYNLVTRLLKDEMGFDGLVVTDALNMHALTTNYTQKEVGMLAIQAGNDVLLFPANEVEMIDGLVEAVESGKITESRIDESVRKLLKIKKWLKLDENRFVDVSAAKREINKKSHFRLAQDVAERSVTLVKNDQNVLPLDPDTYPTVYSITISDSRFDKVIEEPFLFEKIMNERFGYVKNYRVNFNTKKREYETIVEESKNADLLLLSIYANVKSFTGKIDLHEEQFDFLEQLINLEIPSIAVSFGNPFILSEVVDFPTYLTTYGNVPLSQSAAANAIFGNTPIRGKLPVDLPNTNFSKGAGLDIYPNELYYQVADSNYDFQEVDSLMLEAVKKKVFPGAALLVGHRGRVVYNQNYGGYTYDEDSERISEKSIFDLASLTKVVATTIAAMILYERGDLYLNEKVIKYLPEFNNNGKGNIEIEHLLLHTSGLPAWKPFYRNYSDSAEVINSIMTMELEFKPGEKYQYSDLGMIVLKQVLEKISGMTIDKFLQENIYSLLEMNSTFYDPSPKVWFYCVPTENDNYWRNKLLKGQVHDETAYLLNGVAGHAGLFSTTNDLAKLIYLYLNNGQYRDVEFFSQSTIELFTSRNSELSTRAYGWDTRSEENSSAGNLFSLEHSFGHTGFTGTSIWVDKEEGLFVILLTNRVYPSRENRAIIDFRPMIHNKIFEAIRK